jgi:hypothetical protein
MLPRSIEYRFKDGTVHQLFLDIFLAVDRLPFRIAYQNGGSVGNHYEVADTEADARAAMLIYLIEHELFSPTEIQSINQ